MLPTGNLQHGSVRPAARGVPLTCMLLMGSVNGLNSPFMKHTDDLFDIRAVCLILAVFHGTAAGMDDLHTHLLKPVQFFEHSFIFSRVFLAAITI